MSNERTPAMAANDGDRRERDVMSDRVVNEERMRASEDDIAKSRQSTNGDG
jgi:hypothetical protein